MAEEAVTVPTKKPAVQAKQRPPKSKRQRLQHGRQREAEEEGVAEVAEEAVAVPPLDLSNGFTGGSSAAAQQNEKKEKKKPAVQAKQRRGAAVLKRPAAAQPEAKTKRKQKEKKEEKKPAVQAKATQKKPATRRKPKGLDVSALLANDGDDDSDSMAGLLSEDESEDELDVSALLPDGEDLESTFGDEDYYSSPLQQCIHQFVKKIPTNDWVQLVENWKILADQSSPDDPLPCGSGCTGSGMDQHVINDVTEVHCTVLSLC